VYGNAGGENNLLNQIFLPQMAHISLPDESLPGIVGLFNFRPETAGPLQLLAETLLRGESPLTSGERELIAAYVSHLNNCHFCHTSHASAAMAHLGCDLGLIDDIKNGFKEIAVSPKLRALLNIAAKVQKSGREVREEDIAAARAEGAVDKEIHDTVLIAAAFCMFNRYVDGLGTWAPQDNEAYREMGQRMAFTGYVRYPVQADAAQV
jgi:uncharacterized peroxidase-related enzyme